jgi:hypothetical protein
MVDNKTFIGFDLLMDKIKEKYNPSTESLNYVSDALLKAKCNQIELIKFQKNLIGGMVLHNTIILNEQVFNLTYIEFLFTLFHELTHVYQFNKYGSQKMYGVEDIDVSADKLVPFLKKMELTADEMAVRQLCKMNRLGYITVNNIRSFAQYHLISDRHFEAVINDNKKLLKNTDQHDSENISKIYREFILKNL